MSVATDHREQCADTALTIAGSDSGGGAGVQADLKTFSAFGVYGASVITAITAQNTLAVTAVHDVPDEIIGAQLDAVLDDIHVGAIKIGMLSSVGIIKVVKDRLRRFEARIVLDPVMVAKSGDRLLRPDAVAALRDGLLPLATVLTPNLPEAADLLGTESAQDTATMLDQGKALLALGPRNILMKGGHAPGQTCTDLLISADASPREFSAPRVDTRNTHGTGCSMSAAIAAGLAKGLAVPDAVSQAHDWLHGAIAGADSLGIGTGHGPVHHFHRIWS